MPAAAQHPPVPGPDRRHGSGCAGPAGHTTQGAALQVRLSITTTTPPLPSPPSPHLSLYLLFISASRLILPPSILLFTSFVYLSFHSSPFCSLLSPIFIFLYSSFCLSFFLLFSCFQSSAFYHPSFVSHLILPPPVFLFMPLFFVFSFSIPLFCLLLLLSFTSFCLFLLHSCLLPIILFLQLINLSASPFTYISSIFTSSFFFFCLLFNNASFSLFNPFLFSLSSFYIIIIFCIPLFSVFIPCSHSSLSFSFILPSLLVCL